MEEISFNDRNPWLDNESSFGSIRSVLSAALKTGHLESSRDIEEDCSGGDRPQSLTMIDILKQMDHTRKEINQLSLEIQQILLDKETSDLTDLQVLERHCAKLNELSNHVQQVVEDKDLLINSLQQPHVGDYLQIHASYKKYAYEVFPLITPLLSELGQQLDVIEWGSSLDINDGQMESVLSEISSTMAKLQSFFQSLCSMSASVRNLHAAADSTHYQP